MQRNVSPLTTIIVVLVALGLAAFAWVRLSTGPKPVSQQERGARRQSAGSRRGSTTSTEGRGRRGGGRSGGSRGGGRRGGRAGGREGGAAAAEAQPVAEEHQRETPAAPAGK